MSASDGNSSARAASIAVRCARSRQSVGASATPTVRYAAARTSSGTALKSTDSVALLTGQTDDKEPDSGEKAAGHVLNAAPQAAPRRVARFGTGVAPRCKDGPSGPLSVPAALVTVLRTGRCEPRRVLWPCSPR